MEVNYVGYKFNNTPIQSSTFKGNTYNIAFSGDEKNNNGIKPTKKDSSTIKKIVNSTALISLCAAGIIVIASKSKSKVRLNKILKKLDEPAKKELNITLKDYLYQGKCNLIKELFKKNVLDNQKSEKIKELVEKTAKDKNIKTKKDSSLYDKIIDFLDFFPFWL